MFSNLSHLKISFPSSDRPFESSGLWQMLATPKSPFTEVTGLHTVQSYHFASLHDALHGAYDFVLEKFSQSFNKIEEEDVDNIASLFPHSISSNEAAARLTALSDEALSAAIVSFVTVHTLALAQTQEEISLAKSDATDRMITYLDENMEDVAVYIERVIPKSSTARSLVEINILWDKLGHIAVSDQGQPCIQEAFLHFVVGTPTDTVWHWFESQHKEFSVAKAMGVA